MKQPPHRQYAIHGVTHSGRPFRPSDWAERLAGALSSFRPKGSGIGAHIRYSPYCVPRVVGGVKCVIVNDALRDIEPMAWDFVMGFARDNDLPVVDVHPAAKVQLHEVRGVDRALEAKGTQRIGVADPRPAAHA